MAVRETRTWVCALILAFALAVPVASPARADEADQLYDPGTVSVIDLGLPQSSIEALEAEPLEEYQPGTFSIAATDGGPDGIGEFSAPLSVGIRLKGKAGSFRPLGQKAAFKVKFSQVKGQKFLGLKKMTLNNMVQDPSMVHETLSYQAFRALGVPASRTGYAFVRLNGEALGVYLSIEDLDDVGLEKRFGVFDDPQHIYEGEYGTDVRAEDIEDFEVDEGDDEDLGDLEALVAAVDDELAPDWSDRVDPHADLVEMTRMWAVEKYVGHWDGYAGKDADAHHDLPNNFYLYSDPVGRFQMLPWGTDQTWGVRVPFGSEGGLLFERCLDDASCADLYEDAAAAALESVHVLDLAAVARCTARLLAPWQELEPDPTRSNSADEIAAAVAATRVFAAKRPADLAEWLDVEAPPAWTGPGPCSADEPPPIPVDDDVRVANPFERMVAPAAPVAADLRLDRVRVVRGALSAHFQASVPGELGLRASIATRAGRMRLCAGTASAVAGLAAVRCQLPVAVQRRLAARWLRIALEAELTPFAGTPARLFAEPRLPRAATTSRSP